MMPAGSNQNQTGPNIRSGMSADNDHAHASTSSAFQQNAAPPGGGFASGTGSSTNMSRNLEIRRKVLEVATTLRENGSMYVRIKRAIINIGVVIRLLDHGYGLWRTQPFAQQIMETMESTTRFNTELDALRDWMLEVEYILHTSFVDLMEMSRVEQEMQRRLRFFSGGSAGGSFAQQLPPELSDTNLIEKVFEVSRIMQHAQTY